MWFKYLLICMCAMKAGTRLGMIGKSVGPITPFDALFGIVVNALIIAGILHYWQ